MLKSRIAVILPAVAILAVIGSGAVAQAATIPRIQGSHSVKLTITADKNKPAAVGTSSTSTWKFTPSCAAPAGCGTKLVRPRPSGHPASATTTLKPSGKTYSGKTVYDSACFLNSGQIVNNGYVTTETTNLTVTKVNGSNVATAFTGTLNLVFVPTAIGKKNGCTNDHIAAKFQSA